MKWHVAGLMAVAGIMATSSGAFAGPYADDLTKCIIESSGTEGQTLFVQWFFVGLAKNPSIQQYASVTAEQQTDVDRKLADLWQKLLMQDCRAKTVAGIKYEGTSVLSTAFEALGQTAARTMMTNPATASAMSGYFAYVDKTKLDELLKEAGVPVAAPH